MFDRRCCFRKPLDVYFNKFMGGYPYLCRAVDLSSGGLLAETFAEPELEAERFPVELRLPDDADTLWLWVRPLRKQGTRQAFQFLSVSPPVQRKLERFLSAIN